MATVFEVLIAGEDAEFAEGASRAAFEEIDRLELELSRYLPNSDVTRINNLSPGGTTRVGLDTFRCLELSIQYSRETAGAFDVTLGAWMDCWVAKDKSLLHPTPEILQRARRRSGLDLLDLDPRGMSVHVGSCVPCIDLGAIGKGYAVDRAVELLKEWGITSSLVHGGSSSAFGFGNFPDNLGWPVSITHPGDPSRFLENIQLRETGLGGSGVRKGMHIIDPRKGEPAQGRLATWYCSTSATKSDAVSTALMIMTPWEIEEYVWRNPGEWGIIVEANAGDETGVKCFGRNLAASGANS